MPAPKKPQDHKPPAQAAAVGGVIEVDYNDVTYLIDRANADNLELLEFVEDEQYIKAIRGYVGLDQWAKFKDSIRDEQGRVPSAPFEPFLNAVMAALGGSRDDVPN